MAVCARCRSVLAPDPGARFCPQCGLALPPLARPRIGPGSELELRDASAAASAALPSLGKAVLGHAIGEGGMGVVYRAWLYYNPAGRMGSTPPHPIAVKVLHPLIRGRARAELLFRQEADALGRLSHPNVVHCFGLFEHEGELCLAMELVHGESLSELLRRAETEQRAVLPRLPYSQAWHYLAQLLGALASIHAMGIVHRDVKAANVLVRPDGIVKLTDFGIARVSAEASRDTGGMAPGTGAYMAPEQVSGGALDARADLYSAAIVMFEMMCGITPFDEPGRTELAVRAAQLDEAPPPITKLVRGAPPALDLVFARALAKHPSLRYESARALGEAFRAALGLVDSPGWQAQAELTKVAKTLSMALPQAPATDPDEAAAAGPSLPPTDPSAPPSEAMAWAEAEADRYRTDVMTSFKRK